jgi:hypothetical protein
MGRKKALVTKESWDLKDDEEMRMIVWYLGLVLPLLVEV